MPYIGQETKQGVYYNTQGNESRIKELEEENRRLRESLDIATQCSSKEENGIIRLSEENRRLKEDIEHTIKFNNKCIGELKIENRKLKEEIKRLQSSIK